MTVRISDLIQAVRDTLGEKHDYPNGERRDEELISHSDKSLARYAQRALSEKKHRSPASFYSNPLYDAFTQRIDTAVGLTTYLASEFPLSDVHLNEIALRICYLVQVEGTELASPSQAQALREESASSDMGTS